MANCTPHLGPASAGVTQAWRQRYERLGLRAIPLVGKMPLVGYSWNTEDTGALWQSLAAGVACNIGILVSDGIAVVDADDVETSETAGCGLSSMGISPLAVRTPHGTHYYLRICGVPATYNWSQLPVEVGRGEFRAQNCYVVAPPSDIDGMPYCWANGSPEALACQPVVQWRDLFWLVPDELVVPTVDAVPIRLLHREMPAKARALLKELPRAGKGRSIGRYASRSEAEAAVIADLIFAGWPYPEILSTFDEWRPGKYWESKGADRQRYFDRTYYRVLSRIAAHPTRTTIASCWQAVSANPLWIGTNGYTKRDTLLALLALCWQFGTWEVFAPQRAIAEYVAASQVCVSKTLRVLCLDGFIERLNAVRDRADADHWRIKTLGPLSSELMICDNSPRTEDWDLHELWSASALGRSAGTMYGLLSQTPVSVTWLSRQTGKAWSTVDSALDRLERCGLSKAVQSGWIQGARTLRQVADEFHTKSRAHRRQQRHAADRERFAEWHDT